MRRHYLVLSFLGRLTADITRSATRRSYWKIYGRTISTPKGEHCADVGVASLSPYTIQQEASLQTYSCRLGTGGIRGLPLINP